MHKYPQRRDTIFSGPSLEENKLILSEDTLEEFQGMIKSTWGKLQERFAPTRPEEKQKVWVPVLSVHRPDNCDLLMLIT